MPDPVRLAALQCLVELERLASFAGAEALRHQRAAAEQRADQAAFEDAARALISSLGGEVSDEDRRAGLEAHRRRDPYSFTFRSTKYEDDGFGGLTRVTPV